MFNINLSGFTTQIYPPCVSTQRNTNYKKQIKMQLEQRNPPLTLTPTRFDEVFNLWSRGITEDKPLLSEQNFQEYPRYTANVRVAHRNVPKTTFSDTPTENVFDIILYVKDKAESMDRIQFDFWLPSPSCLNARVFDEKSITYMTNFLHRAAVGSSSGRDHAITLQKGLNLQNDSESINRLYNMCCSRLLCPETDLYKVQYTEYGINCRYISAFIDYQNPTKFIYVFHSWQTNYFRPEPRDLEALALRKGKNFFTEEPFLDGWARPVTIYCKLKKDLKSNERAFVERRNRITEQDVRLIDLGAQEDLGNWRIESKEIILANANDWREALPPRETGKNYGFYDVPQSHCVYNPENYPYDLFGRRDVQIERPVSRLPYGEFYGIN